jgi:hypothetical protein
MLIHPELRDALAHDAAAERRRVVERDRRAQPGPLRRGVTKLVARLSVAGRGRPAPVPAEVRIRFATEHDRRTWPELRPDATEHVLVADVDGAPRAALSLVDGAVLAAAEPRRAARARRSR